MALNGLTTKEVKEVLKDKVWRGARSKWSEKAMGKSKLEMTERLIESKCKGSMCWDRLQETKEDNG